MTQSATAVETPAVPVLRALNPRTLSIDIVLPVLNEAHVIARSVSTLHAYLSQHVPHRWRIIIADNGSTDGTAEAAHQLALRYPEVQLIQLAEKAVAGLSSKRGYRARPIFWPIWISTSPPI